MTRFFPIILLFIGGIVLTIGDIIMKNWVITNKYFYFGLGIIIYIIANCILAYCFKFKNIAVASMILVIFNIVTLSIISIVCFKEKLTIVQITGMILGLISVLVLEMSQS